MCEDPEKVDYWLPEIEFDSDFSEEDSEDELDQETIPSIHRISVHEVSRKRSVTLNAPSQHKGSFDSSDEDVYV